MWANRLVQAKRLVGETTGYPTEQCCHMVLYNYTAQGGSNFFKSVDETSFVTIQMKAIF